ncbi:FG-GAP-like repeat-containing protein [Caenimonas aquaedulcis]|uniref:VCBS repeat-containing protein n=1 Tax=Caenimonas aquaedulcis TaxID=2793270 RepID=A0A931H634_9BURK|nr:FG-GAP-like repeat-containing protein [Caenimonas aquaedulcis]MBG9389137.1 VCBS repeat-containing protein [Caenimonas aquaedulcis]
MSDTTAPHGTLLFSKPLVNPYGLVDVGVYAQPSIGDIDGDGDPDAIIAEASGRSLVQINTGSATTPIFAAPLLDPYGLTFVSYYTRPSLADIDGDGDLDLFMGDAYGDIQLFLNGGSAAHMVLASPVANPYGLVGVGASYAHPSFVDIDADGDLDVFVGESLGNTVCFMNTGNATHPAFAAPVANPFGLTNVGASACPTFADIDQDGDQDAFVGDRMGDIRVYVNSGSATAPVFEGPQFNLYGLGDVGDYATPTFADLDNDGDLDLFIGNADGDTWLFLNNGSFIAPVTSSTPDGTYGAGSVITLSVTFSESVTVDATGGVPTLALETGPVDRVATYTGGSGTSTLTFAYTVQPGDISADLDIASTHALVLNGARIRDDAGNDAILALASPGEAGSLAANAALAIYADNTAPTATLDTVTVKNTGSSVTVQSTEPGTAYLVKTSVAVTDVSSITKAANASWNQVAVPAANADVKLSTAGLGEGNYKLFTADASGNLSVASSGTVTIDNTAPTAGLADATLPANGIAAAQSSEAGTAYLVNTSVAVSGLASILGSGDANWNKVSIAAANVSTALATTGLASGMYRLYATDMAGNLSAASSGTVTVDAAAPAGASVTSASADGTYRAGSVITLNVSFSEAVFVDSAGGTPVLRLETGSSDRLATYSGGSGTRTLSFSYTVHAGDTAADLDYSSTAALTLGGSILRDAAGNNAVRTLAAPGSVGSLAAHSALVIDGINDVLVGTNGADKLDGGVGADTMTGGDGDDRYYVDNAGDVVVESVALPEGGIDTVYTMLPAYTLGANVERGYIQATAAANLSGNSLNNIFTAGSGPNVIDGAGGTDQVTYASASSGVTVNLSVAGAQSTGGSGLDTLVSIENLTGSAWADALTGNAGANQLVGGAGADTLAGLGGNDGLTGGAGADVFVFDSAGGSDVIRDFSAAQGDKIRLASHINGSGIVDGATALAHLSDVGGNAVLDLGSGCKITLTGISSGSLSAADFLFV